MTESEPWSYHADGSPVYSLADIVRKRSAATPDAIALAEPGRLTSFAALDRRSSQVARALQAGGVRPGDRVAFIGANGPEFTEVGYGAAKCRAIFTAVNNRLAAREILGILAGAEPPDDPGEIASPDETALILYTSGTTGAPKGVELIGRNLGCAPHELHCDIGLDEKSTPRACCACWSTAR
jgi:acyl-CoA synthetase (AMP-forming)/AMP-acid ligase II